jgi:hypothetical protein
MRVLYLGPYRQVGFDGNLSRCYVNTLLETGLDLTIRPIYTSQLIDNGIDHRFLQAEYNNKNKTFDVVIEHVAPHSYEYNHKCGKHIGIYPAETRNHRFISWPYRANLLDEIWVTNNEDMANLKSDEIVNVPILAVPPGINTSKYQTDPKPFEFDITDKFIFYYSGPADNRFQLEKALIAFHTEFDPSENVIFVIQINSPQHPQTNAEQANKVINKVKEGLRIYPAVKDYIPDAVIPEVFDEVNQDRFHAVGDCLVFLPVGSQMNTFVLDALGFGNQVVTTDDYVEKPVKFNYESLYELQHELSDMYTGREVGKSVIVADLRRALREAYDNGKIKDKKDLSLLSYAERAKEIKKVLGVNE